jgi:hypothetical protein
MFTLTYDQWNAIIEEVIGDYIDLFDAMGKTATSIKLSKSLVDKLKQKGSVNISDGDWQFLLAIELYDDEIGGFKISLLSLERRDDFDQAIREAAASQGASFEDIRNFEAEHGLNLIDEILDQIEEEYAIIAQGDGSIVFELVVFDSEDLDNNARLGNDLPNSGS